MNAFASFTPTPTQFGLQAGTGKLVQNPKEMLKGNLTSNTQPSLTSKTMEMLAHRFASRDHHPSPSQYAALQDLVWTMERMANGTLTNGVYLSSLDPGVGKTSAVTEFIKQLLASPDHQDTSVLLCVGRLEEVRRLVGDLDLEQSEFSILTGDPEINSLGTPNANHARVLISTHAMVASRCAGQTFAETSCFHYNNQPRQVRVWDEAMLRGEIVSLNTDDLNCLPQYFRSTCPSLGDFAGQLADQLLLLAKGISFEMPNVAKATGIDLSTALSKCDQKQPDSLRAVIENLYALSGETVRLSMGNGRVTTALNTRDARPRDLEPILVLDASGRVRYTYEAWEKGPGGLKRLRSATKDYSNLSIKIMEKGGGKSSFRDKGELYVAEMAKLINSNPGEEWLVVYHLSAMNGRLPNALKELINTNQDRISFVNWGAHQGRNDFGHIPNVILAGTLIYPQHQYEGLAYMSAGIPTTTSLPEVLVRDVRLGEHMDLILQGLCRVSVRGSIGDRCKPCTAYIIASKDSGIRAALPTVFPGCRITRWTALPSAARGKVAEAIAMLKAFKLQQPEDALLFNDMMARLGIDNRSNFNKTIRRHEQFKEAIADLGFEEVVEGEGRHKNAFSLTFSPIPGATCVTDVYATKI